MKITFDTADKRVTDDADMLGYVLGTFLSWNGGHPHFGRDPKAPGWTTVSTTPREILVALMGDTADEDGFRATHIRHDETDLEVIWYTDGDLVLMFHHPEDGFTIMNSHHGLGDNWSHVDLTA